MIRHSDEKDYAAAAAYFRQLGPYYAKDQWSDLELVMFDKYAQCLEHLDEYEDFVPVCLKIIAKVVKSLQTSVPAQKVTSSGHGSVTRRNYLSRLISASQTLRELIVIPLDHCFGSVSLSRFITHEQHKDSFYLRMEIDHVLAERFTAEEIRCTLSGEDSHTDAVLGLSAANVVFEPQSRVTVYLESSTMVPGRFLVDEIRIRAGRLAFVQELSGAPESPFKRSHSIVEMPSVPRPVHRVLLWPQPRALDVQLSLSRSLSLDQRRSLDIKLLSGWNQISTGSLVLRAGSAGLRLHTSDAESIGPPVLKAKVAEPGLFDFENVPADTTLQVRVPYTLESEVNEVTVKISVTYRTAEGEFVFASTMKAGVILALSINVQDNFQKDFLISKFTMGTATMNPVRIMACNVHGTDDFSVTSLPLPSWTNVLPGQPASLMCKIKHDQDPRTSSQGRRLQRELRLSIQYVCLDEEVEACLKNLLMTRIEVSPFSQMARLLLQPLVNHVRRQIKYEDLEAIGLLRRFDVAPIHYGALDHILEELPRKHRGPLMRWLQQWQEVWSPPDRRR